MWSIRVLFVKFNLRMIDFSCLCVIKYITEKLAWLRTDQDYWFLNLERRSYLIILWSLSCPVPVKCSSVLSVSLATRNIFYLYPLVLQNFLYRNIFALMEFCGLMCAPRIITELHSSLWSASLDTRGAIKVLEKASDGTEEQTSAAPTDVIIRLLSQSYRPD